MICGTLKTNVQETIEDNAEFHIQKYEVDILSPILLLSKATSHG